ncbi:hypothetical protein EMPG_14008, partial [Blastomyces silverae]
NLHYFRTARTLYSIYKVKLKIISEILSELKNFIEIYLTIYYNETVFFIKNEFDVNIHLYLISRVLKKLN